MELTADAHFVASLSLSLSVQMMRNHPLFAGNPQAAEMVSYRRRGGRKGGEVGEGLNTVANDEYHLVHVAIGRSPMTVL